MMETDIENKVFHSVCHYYYSLQALSVYT